MFYERPLRDYSRGVSSGGDTTLGEIWDATWDSTRMVDNFNGSAVSLERAYDARNDAIHQAIGIELKNPMREFMVDQGQRIGQVPFGKGGVTGLPGIGYNPRDPHALYQTQIERLAEQHPDFADIIAPDRPVIQDARRLAAAAEHRFENVWDRADGGLSAWATRLTAGFGGTFTDPVNVATAALFGPFGEAGVGLKGLVWMGVKAGAANAAGEAVAQPFVQQWRKEAGLPHGLDLAAANVAAAALFGFGLDAGARSVIRGVRRAAGRPYLGPAADASGAPRTAETDSVPLPSTGDPLSRLEEAARAAPEGSALRNAAGLDPTALREVAEASGAVADPAVRGGLTEMETNEAFAGLRKPEAGLSESEHLRQLASAVRHAATSDSPPAGDAVIAPPAKPGPDLADSAPARLGATEMLEGKPVHFLSVDPLKVVTDASTFQFKSEGDAAGVTARLRSVKRWDPLSAGKAFIFERANGEMVIADGHQRRGLAARLADQQPKPMLHAYVFREADGWTPADVRAHAALKNMRELSGAAVDMAKVMRERPDLIDDSLPLSDGKMREAVMLARLSDEAFGAVVAGRLPPTFAALIGEHVTDPGRHAGLLNEIAAADLANAAQARFYLAQLLELPTTTEVQHTLFGEEAITRTLMAERSRVLDASLRGLKSDKRIFGLLDREARRISESGNVLDREGNAARAQDAGQLGELIEKLATTRGTVATLLNDAAIAVSRGLSPVQASRAFVRRIGDILDREGLNGLLKAEPPASAEMAPLRIDEPNGAEAKAQVEALEQNADQGVMFAIRAFHASPHEFERFDLSKIGTGEGAQVFGHGLYFAENEAVSGHGGAYYKQFLDSHGSAHAYQVSIDAEPEQLLHWDKPLSEQSPEVQKALSPLLKRLAMTKAVKSDPLDRRVARLAESGEISVPRLMEALGRSSEDASRLLREAGIPGIRYLDQGSREPTLNGKPIEDHELARYAQAKLDGSLDGIEEDLRSRLDALRNLPPATEEEAGALFSSPMQIKIRRLSSSIELETQIAKVDEVKSGDVKAPEGTHNFVIFDDSLVKITHKNGAEVTGAERTDALRQMFALRGNEATLQPRAPWNGRAVPTARYAAETLAMRADIDKAISKALPPSWRHEVRDTLVYEGREVEGFADPYERIVYVSMAALDPLERAYEEAGHALKAAKLIPEADYEILRAEAKRLDARKHFDIDARYGKMYGERWQGAALEGRLEEEAIMQMIAAHARGKSFGEPASAARRILDRIVKFFRAIGEALNGRGFRGYENVFQDLVSGRLARPETLPEAQTAGSLVRMREVMFSTGEGGDQGANGSPAAGAGAAVPGPQPAAGTDPAARPGAQAGQGGAERRPRGNIRDVINGALAEGRLTREDADAMLTRFDELERHYRSNPPQAAQQLADEIDAEALLRQRQRLLGEERRQTIESYLLDFRDERGQPDPARAMIAMLDHHGVVALPQGLSSTVGRERAILGASMARMTDMLGEFSRTRLTGRTRNRARLDNVVRELFGEGTGDAEAREFARVWSEVSEDLRRRYNAAGGAIGRLEQWGLPQAHDRIALLRRGMERWIGDITPLLDPARMRNPLTGNAMTQEELRRSLEWIYREITSDGWHEREASMVRRGLGAVANQRGAHRFLVFRNADAWLRYQADYGAGGNPFVSMMSHLRGMSRDIADMEVLGPNPRGMLTYMQEVVQKQAAQRAAGQPALFPDVTRITGRRMAGEGNWLAVKNAEDYSRSLIELAENMYNIRRGHAGAAVNSRVAAVFDVMRNLNVANQLGGAFLSAATDAGFQRSARAFAGLSQTRILGDIVRENFSRESRFDAVRAGLILDSALDTLREDARFFGSMNGPAWSRVIADRTLNWSLLQSWTQAGKHAWGKAVMLEFADNVGQSFAELPGRLSSMLQRYGLDSADWDGMRLGADGNPRIGLDYLTPMGVYEERQAAGLNDTLHERYLEMILQEGEYAVPTGTLEAQARSYGSLRRGVLIDEVRRSAMQYKMFGLTVAMLQSQRVVAETLMRGVVTGATIAAGLVIGTTLLGGLSIQLKELSRGKDARPMDNTKFWLAAFLQGGGAGIFGDFLFAEQNRFGGGLAETVAGPTVGNLAQGLRLTAGNLQRGAKGERTNFGREFTQFLGRNTPGSSLWYLRLGYERVLLDQLQALADPEAKAAWRRRVQMQKRDYGNDFYWQPGELAPQRAPTLSTR